RRILTGGAPVSDGELRTWLRAFPEAGILVAYGSTEAEPVAHISARERLEAVNADRPRTPGVCAGRPVDRVRAKVIRIHAGPVELEEDGWAGWELPRGEIGELAVTGDHVCKDYYRNERAVRENKIVDSEGTVWHRMGDTGSLDPEGRFWIAGRVHSTIRRGGELVHPQLVEQAALGDDPRIRRLGAVGLPDPVLGEKVELVIQIRPGDEKGEVAAQLFIDVTARLTAAGLKADVTTLTSRELPVDPRHNSKIDYGRLRELLIR
ncbi:MAG TPA: AMP-binding protein, partial [Thermoanaerobaculia bacterium]|nr:AMP-binding protein [Thermoanaerobaculia bacterium]